MNLRDDILRSLGYFDMFNYPLNGQEIFLFLPVKADPEQLISELDTLVAQKIIFRFDALYSLKDDRTRAERRLLGNARAVALMRVARKVSRVIALFPFVRGVAISGSLSKNYADEHDDIDFFIITAGDRLWIARTALHALKKLLFLFNWQRFFCLNYFISEKQLEIPEKNRYTAIEIATLIPMEGNGVFNDFFRANAWTRDLLPNHPMRWATADPVRRNPVKGLIETLFVLTGGTRADTWLWRITARRWDHHTRKEKQNDKGKVMVLETGKQVARPEAGRYQAQLLARYEQRLRLFIPDRAIRHTVDVSAFQPLTRNNPPGR